MAAGEIRSSLFGAADAAGLPDAVTLQLADVFAGDIDFYHDLRRGDRFAVVYEMRYVDGEPVGAGRIVAAEFANRGAVVAGVPVARRRRQRGSYYTEDGAALRKAFLRSPMEFSRVTSGFSQRALPPDPADTGARTRASTTRRRPARRCAPPANGMVAFAGTQNGYGNVVQLQHQGAFSTLYAHLSRFAPQVRAGRARARRAT